MKILKIGLIIVVVGLLAYGVLYLTLKQIYDSKIQGDWELTSGDLGCFEDLSFVGGVPSNQVLSMSEVIGSSKTIYMGSSEIKDDKIIIEIDNFSNIPAFEMIYVRNKDDLNVQYDWNEESYHCDFNLKEE